ncbi:MAG: 50S ribosomal protein L4, partial [Candidatus Omnitrophica bacterium]|nr:50S ribosomal protein L4 [Candidatus Omnitrophota bacterium]
SKLNENDLFCVDQLTVQGAKTKDFANMLKGLKLEGKILAVVDSMEENVEKISRNIPSFCMMRSCDVTAHDILRNKKLLITKSAFKDLIKRIQ